MWIWMAIVAAVPVGLMLIAGLFLLVVLRTGYGPGVTVVRRFNRRFTNRRVMKTAGTPGAPASVIRHTGRISGTVYETPIGITEAGDDFLVSLPYGTDPDWLKNFVASGTAEVVHEGTTYRVVEPELVPAASVAAQQSPAERFGLWLFGVDEVLRMRKTATVQ
ncbi:nitroreductase/quinone reductase family protein [Nocardia sp. NPDC050793]|uniref:nitroreductase/quinone reductase family protein n=1 Tax=Nocardia sp. NPDC050793 TaxID=3155159 RepID=UPI00340BEC2C